MYLATDGNEKYQFKYMHKKATAWVGGALHQERRWGAGEN